MKNLTRLIFVVLIITSCNNNKTKEISINKKQTIIKTEQTIRIDTIFPNGDVYMGEWKNNKPNGKGLYVLDNKTRFDGFFVDGKLEGFGTKIKEDSYIYTGEFKKSKFNGKGTCEFEEGVVFEGEWKDNLLHGKGSMTTPDGTKINGFLKKGEFIDIYTE